MIIAVNTTSLIKDSTGAGEFINKVFFRITKQNPHHTFIFIFDRPYDPSLIFSENTTPVVISKLPAKPLLLRLWYDYKIPSVLKKYNAGIFVSFNITSLRTKIPQCLIIDDLSFLQYPQLGSKSNFDFYKKYTPKFLKKAKVIVTLSESAKNEMTERYKIEEEKIDVIHSGVNESLAPVTIDQREIIKEKYAAGNEYFLFIGEITPKNNLTNLLKAFSFFKKRQKSSMKLLICGTMGWKHEEFTESLGLFKFKNEVNVYTNLEKEEQLKIVASAYAMVDASYFQGFNLVPIQAMKCEVPLLVSNTDILHETFGDAALYLDPKDHKMMAENMMLIFKDEELRKQIIEKGTRQIQYYNWDKTATLLWQSILKTNE